jgi:hypothetical protein
MAHKSRQVRSSWLTFFKAPDELLPVLPEDILKEAIPGNIRRAEHFTAFLARFVEYLKTRMRVLHVVAETPASFLQHLKELTFIEKKPLKSVHALLSNEVRQAHKAVPGSVRNDSRH